MRGEGQEQAGDERYAWRVMAVVMVGTCMATLDSSIVNVSIPKIMADFGSQLQDIEWVVTGYMLAFAALMPMTSWLRDHVGHKRLYLWALVLFTGGSLACALAWNLPSLIAARVLQALGGGAITPTGMAMITEVFPPRTRGKAIGYWGMGVIAGPAVGPTLGGYLTNAFGWRSIFTVNLPIGILGVLLAGILLKPDVPHESQRRPFDAWGFAFLTLFLVSFLLGLSKGEDKGWGSTFLLSCWGLAGLGLVGFLLVELQVKGDGIMDLGLLKHPVFAASMVMNFVRSVALFGGTFLVPLFLQNLAGYDELQCGLIMLPASLLVAAVMPVSGRLGDKVGPFLPSFIGLVLCAYSLYLYFDVDVTTPLWDIIYPQMIRSVGMGLLMAPVIAAAMNSVPARKTGMAAAMLNVNMQVSGSVGIALLTTVLSHRTTFHAAAYAAALKAGDPAFADSLGRVAASARGLGLNHADSLRVAGAVLGRHLGQRAAVAGFDDAFLVAAVLVAVGVVAALPLPKKPVHGPAHGVNAAAAAE